MSRREFDRAADALRSALARMERMYDELDGERVAPNPVRPERPGPQPVPPKRGEARPLPTVMVQVGRANSDRTQSLVTLDGRELTRGHLRGLEARVYRTQAGGVARTVVALVARHSPAFAVGMRVLLDPTGGGFAAGQPVMDYQDSWALDPGQAWVASYYTGGSAADYWAARGARLMRDVPAWAPAKLEAALVELQKLPRIGPFQPGHQSDRGDAPGADFGVSTNGHAAWLCPEGLALFALEMEQAAQRCRVFHIDTEGRPYWWSIPGGQWMSWEPKIYAADPEAALRWWPDYDRIAQLRTFDDQHSARGWRSASVLKDIDPFAAWYLSNWANRMALQWGQSHDDENSLLRGMEAVLHRTKEGEGSESLGRAGLWAALLAQQASHPLERRFFELIRKASHPRTGEVMAVPRHWVPDQNTGAIGPEELVGLTHEMAISVAVREHLGCDLAGAAKLGALLVNTPGKCKVFGEDRWELQPLPYVELQAGDFTQYGSVKQFLQVCAGRSALGSDQPLLACPRVFWEGEL